MCSINIIELILFEVTLTLKVQGIGLSGYNQSTVNTRGSVLYLFNRLDHENSKCAWFQSRTRTRIIGSLLRCGSKFCSG